MKASVTGGGNTPTYTRAFQHSADWIPNRKKIVGMVPTIFSFSVYAIGKLTGVVTTVETGAGVLPDTAGVYGALPDGDRPDA